MVWIPAGEFSMGCEDAEMRDARPFHRVALDGFWMDKTEVTNAEFARFVKATGYVTLAERQLNPKDFPGVPADNLVPGSAVFVRLRTLSNLTIITTGGDTFPAPTGDTPMGPKAI
jgi:formylglycine-generating enzyme required for sulfatase activity